MMRRMKGFWTGPSMRQRLADLEATCRAADARVEALTRDLRRTSDAQAEIETRLASLQSTVERALADVERLHADHAGLHRVAASLPAFAAIAEEVRSLRAGQAALHAQLHPPGAEHPLTTVETFRDQLDDLKREVGRLSRFVLKATDDRVPAPPTTLAPPPRLEHPLPIEAQFEELEAMMPRTFRLWKDLLDYNRESYTGFPVHSCSVPGHPSASVFTYFVNQFLRGYVLDIGCGPQPVPLYLQQYPAAYVYGIDPISTAERHPFNFYQGVAEFLPWGDRSFDVAIAATSLDHVLFLDKALREVHRVLKDDGELLVWVAFVAGSAPYDPCAPDIEPVDEYHLFHFTEPFFEEAMAGLFAVKDKLRVNMEIDHHFYRLAKLPVEPSADASSAVVAPHTAEAGGE